MGWSRPTQGGFLEGAASRQTPDSTGSRGKSAEPAGPRGGSRHGSEGPRGTGWAEGAQGQAAGGTSPCGHGGATQVMQGKDGLMGRGGGQEKQKQQAPEPRATAASPQPAAGAQAGAQGPTPTFAKEIWAMGAPGWGFCREIRFPPLCSAESGAQGGGGGGEITAPSSSVGRKSSTLAPRPRPGYPDPSLPSTPPWDPKPQHPPSRVSTGRTHLGPGTLGPGRTGWLVHAWRGPCGVDQGPAEDKDAGAQARGQSQEEEALESGSGGKAFQREQDGPTRQRQQSAQRLKSGDTQATAQRGTSRGSARPLGPRGSGGRRRGWGEC